MAGIVLAGGQSRRMGQDKALLVLGGQPLVVRVAERVRRALGDVLVVAPAERLGTLERLGLRAVPDRYPARGPLAGLHAGLVAAGDGYHFAISCDQPFVEPGAVAYLMRLAGSEAARRAPAPGPDAVVPRAAGHLQVLHAVYHARVASVAEELILAGVPSVRALLERLDWVEVEPGRLAGFGDPERMFFNVNTPEALRVARALEAGRRGAGRRPGEP